MNKHKKVAIIGAGPAGLTAAYQLLEKTDLIPYVFESNTFVGGIAATRFYKGNLIDFGGHRFFTKSDRVLDWWLSFLPLEKTKNSIDITYHKKTKKLKNVSRLDPKKSDNVMLIRDRKSSILYNGKFYSYPISLSVNTIQNFGLLKVVKVITSYLLVHAKSTKDNNLEEFLISRYGNELYKMFFEKYTEKLWGVPVREISADWGKQRIHSLSLGKTLTSGFFRLMGIKNKHGEKSLIERFLYPKYGPGHLWNLVAKEIEDGGGKIYLNEKVISIKYSKKNISTAASSKRKIQADYIISTAPVPDLMKMLTPKPPLKIRKIGESLHFRNFIIVGVLVPKSIVKKFFGQELSDTWIYLHDSSVEALRMQIFNNWSPYLVKDKRYYWLGLEYFCGENDKIWSMPDKKILLKALKDLKTLGFISDIKKSYSGKVFRVPKAYPSYTNGYKDMPKVHKYFDDMKNLYLVGRNGMHRYNNQDHSMLAAMKTVDHIVSSLSIKSKAKDLNIDEEG